MKSRGFTLIELLVVISIVALLASVVLASLNSARQKGRIGSGKYFAAQVDHIAGDQGVLLLDFDECSGTVATDRSGFGNNAPIFGATYLPSDTPTGVGCSLSVGSLMYAQVASASVASFPSLPFTVSFWVKQSAGQNRSGMVATAQFQNGGWMVAEGLSGANAQPFFEINGAGTSCSIAATADMPLNEWVNLVSVYDGSSAMTIYQNGLIVASGTCASALTANTYGVIVGKTLQGGWGLFTGFIDAVHIYGKALTASEVGRLYAIGRAMYPLAQNI